MRLCWHKWSEWEDITDAQEARICVKEGCKKYQIRFIRWSKRPREVIEK